MQQRSLVKRRKLRLCVRRGATLVLLGLLLPIAVLLSAFAINYAYMELCQTELVISTDAATRAAGRELALTGDIAAARAAGRAAAARNPVANVAQQLADADFTFGQSSRSAIAQHYSFTPTTVNPNAVRVNARRTTGSLNGAIPLMMPNVLGVGTFQTQHMAQSTQVEVDVALVIDRSGSMAYAATEVANGAIPPAAAPPGWNWGMHVPPQSRWLDTVNGVNAFINELNASPTSERTSLSTYNSASTVDLGFTTTYSTILTTLDGYTQAFNGGATNVASGIDAGVTTFSGPNARPWATKVIVLLTDGIQTVPGDPVASATNAANNGVMIFAITFSDEADQAAMEAVAQAGCGKHYHASTGSELTTVFREIAQSLPTLLTQ